MQEAADGQSLTHLETRYLIRSSISMLPDKNAISFWYTPQLNMPPFIAPTWNLRPRSTIAFIATNRHSSAVASTGRTVQPQGIAIKLRYFSPLGRLNEPSIEETFIKSQADLDALTKCTMAYSMAYSEHILPVSTESRRLIRSFSLLKEGETYDAFHWIDGGNLKTL